VASAFRDGRPGSAWGMEFVNWWRHLRAEIETTLPGCFVIRPHPFVDGRGAFVKTFHAPGFEALGLETVMQETFWSTSKRAVIRGLHYQAPPHDHAKIVTCVRGAMFAAVVDLRSRSSSFGRHIVVALDADDPRVIYVPRGMAHGFQALEDDCTVLYQTSSPHEPSADLGVRWDSCGIPWPEIPTLSSRDRELPSFAEYANNPAFE
jgi:dTDP-4-dehydrorhamnose 3,5-epimerase